MQTDLLQDEGVRVSYGQSEIIDAISASLLRQVPSARVRLTVTTAMGNGERTLGDYVLEHAGTFDRSSGG